MTSNSINPKVYKKKKKKQKKKEGGAVPSWRFNKVILFLINQPNKPLAKGLEEEGGGGSALRITWVESGATNLPSPFVSLFFPFLFCTSTIRSTLSF